MKDPARADGLLAIVLFVLAASAQGAEPRGAVTAATAPLNVKLLVTPAPTSFADVANNPLNGAPFSTSPKVGDGQKVTLTATLPPSVLGAVPYPLYRFTAVLSPSGQTFVIKNLTKSHEVTWTPPKGGDYKFTVVARRGLAQGSDSIENFHVRPSATSPITLTSNPAVKAVGAFTIFAAVIGPPAATRHEFWFSYVVRFPFTSPPNWEGSAATSTGNHPGVSHQNLPPGLYNTFVYARSYVNHVLVSEGFAKSEDVDSSYFYRGFYAVLFPPGPCPTQTVAVDPTQGFSWTTVPITPEYVSSFTNLSDGLPLHVDAQPGADCSIAGYSINDIANAEQLRVRKINVSCTNCHRDMMALKGFLCTNTWFPHIEYPDYGAQAEDTLSQLINNWRSRGCPN